MLLKIFYDIRTKDSKNWLVQVFPSSRSKGYFEPKRDCLYGKNYNSFQKYGQKAKKLILENLPEKNHKSWNVSMFQNFQMAANCAHFWDFFLVLLIAGEKNLRVFFSVLPAAGEKNLQVFVSFVWKSCHTHFWKLIVSKKKTRKKNKKQQQCACWTPQ